MRLHRFTVIKIFFKILEKPLDIFAGMVHGTALAFEDVTGLAYLAAKYFHAETLAF